MSQGFLTRRQAMAGLAGLTAWGSTVFIINFDEWGGFFEHVPPPMGAVTGAEQALGYTDGLRGFRVPCVVISPWSQAHPVSHTVFDHTSILNMIEWRFGLQPLAVRDVQANNLATLLDFKHPRLDVPQANVPPGPYGGACPPAPAPGPTPTGASSSTEDSSATNEWPPVRNLAAQHGWKV